METIVLSKRKTVNQWNKNYLSPGAVGAVGDTIQNVRLRSSASELPPRWEFSRAQLKQKGSGVGDGTVPNNYTGMSYATTAETNYYTTPYEKQVMGTMYQDLRPNDLAATTRELGAPQFGWRSTQASVNKALVMGKQFLPSPNGYPRSGLSRGPEPRSTFLADVSSIVPQTLVENQAPQLNPVAPTTGVPLTNIGGPSCPAPTPTLPPSNLPTPVTPAPDSIFNQFGNMLGGSLGLGRGNFPGM